MSLTLPQPILTQQSWLRCKPRQNVCRCHRCHEQDPSPAAAPACTILKMTIYPVLKELSFHGHPRCQVTAGIHTCRRAMRRLSACQHCWVNYSAELSPLDLPIQLDPDSLSIMRGGQAAQRAPPPCSRRQSWPGSSRQYAASAQPASPRRNRCRSAGSRQPCSGLGRMMCFWPARWTPTASGPRLRNGGAWPATVRRANDTGIVLLYWSSVGT